MYIGSRVEIHPALHALKDCLFDKLVQYQSEGRFGTIKYYEEGEYPCGVIFDGDEDQRLYYFKISELVFQECS